MATSNPLKSKIKVRKLSVSDLPKAPPAEKIGYREPPVRKIGMVRKKKETDKAFTVRALQKFCREHCKEQLKHCRVDSIKELDSQIGKKTIERWETEEGQIVCRACPSSKASDDTWIRWGEYMGFRYTFKGSKKSKIVVCDAKPKPTILKKYKKRSKTDVEKLFNKGMLAIKDIAKYHKILVDYEWKVHDDRPDLKVGMDKIRKKYEDFHMRGTVKAYDDHILETRKKTLLDAIEGDYYHDEEIDDTWNILKEQVDNLTDQKNLHKKVSAEVKAFYNDAKKGVKKELYDLVENVRTFKNLPDTITLNDKLYGQIQDAGKLTKKEGVEMCTFCIKVGKKTVLRLPVERGGLNSCKVPSNPGIGLFHTHIDKGDESQSCFSTGDLRTFAENYLPFTMLYNPRFNSCYLMIKASDSDDAGGDRYASMCANATIGSVGYPCKEYNLKSEHLNVAISDYCKWGMYVLDGGKTLKRINGDYRYDNVYMYYDDFKDCFAGGMFSSGLPPPVPKTPTSEVVPEEYDEFVYNPYGFTEEEVKKPAPKPTPPPAPAKVVKPKPVPKKVVKPKVVKKPAPKKVVEPEPTPVPKKVVKKPVKKVVKPKPETPVKKTVKKTTKKPKATLKGTKLTAKQKAQLKDLGYCNVTRNGKKHRITPSRVNRGIVKR